MTIIHFHHQTEILSGSKYPRVLFNIVNTSTAYKVQLLERVNELWLECCDESLDTLFSSSSWSCQCTCGCGTVVEKGTSCAAGSSERPKAERWSEGSLLSSHSRLSATLTGLPRDRQSGPVIPLGIPPGKDFQEVASLEMEYWKHIKVCRAVILFTP